MNSLLKYFLLPVIVLSFPELCYAQQRYSFEFHGAELKDVIKELSHQSKTNILYNPNILPSLVRISGVYKNLTFPQALDTFLHRNQILYKFYKKDVVLYKRNEEVKETHQAKAAQIPKKTTPFRAGDVYPDTVRLTVLTFDTVTQTRTEYVKIPVNDTVRIYDTIQVIRKLNKPAGDYHPKNKSFSAEISVLNDLFHSSFTLPSGIKENTDLLKSSLSEKHGQGTGLNFIYRNRNFILQAGVQFLEQRYSFRYTHDISTYEQDSSFRYILAIAGNDTTWGNRLTKIETQTRVQYFSDLYYTYITIPFMAGYSMPLKKWNIEWKGGITGSWYTGSKGFYLTFKNDTIISVEEAKAPNRVFTLGLTGAVGFDYTLSEKTHFSFNPWIFWNAIPLGSKKQVYYNTDVQIGIQLGLRYCFF